MDEIFKLGKSLLSGGGDDEEDDEQGQGSGRSGMDKLMKIGKQVLAGDEEDDEPEPISMETGIPMLDTVFKAFDRNGDGRVNAADLMLMLKAVGLGFVPESVVQTVFDQVDTNQNDHLDLSEFMTIVGLVQAASVMFGK